MHIFKKYLVTFCNPSCHVHFHALISPSWKIFPRIPHNGIESIIIRIIMAKIKNRILIHIYIYRHMPRFFIIFIEWNEKRRKDKIRLFATRELGFSLKLPILFRGEEEKVVVIKNNDLQLFAFINFQNW